MTDGELTAQITGITRWFDRAVDDLRSMNRDFCDALTEESLPFDDAAQIAKAGKGALKRRVGLFLREHPRVDGAGLIFARSVSGGGKGVIDWWVRDGEHDLARYAFGLNPVGARFYDYEKLEWYVVSSETGGPWLTGPYIDYLGVDEYVVTLTVASIVHGRTVGVAGMDIRMGDFERELLPLLSALPGAAMLLNSHGGVLVSSSSRFATGDLLAETPEDFTRIELPLDGVRLAVLCQVSAAPTAA